MATGLALRRAAAAQGIVVSDRRWRQLVGLLRSAAFLEGRTQVEPLDLWLVPYVIAAQPAQVPALQDWFVCEVAQAGPQDAPWLTRAVEAFVRMAEDLKRHQDREIAQARLQAEYERKSQELEDARLFQLSLLPKVLPDHPGFEIAVSMRTATEVGGDFYDVLALGEERVRTVMLPYFRDLRDDLVRMRC